jgi:hypothetical protein
MTMLGARSIALALLLASISACDDAQSPSETADDEPGVSPASVRWVLDWGSVSNDGQGFEVMSDLGYRVRVEAGWIGSWGITLIECPAEGEERAPSVELGLASPWLIAEGHASGEDDPSAWVFAGVESLTERRIVEAEPIELDGARYCEVHHLLAPISEASEGFAAAEAALTELDPTASLVGASVLIIGSWEPPGGGAATPFVLRSEQGYGKILELDTTAAGLEGADIEVLLQRELTGMFDQVEFATDEPDDVSWQVLGNLAKQASARARLGE